MALFSTSGKVVAFPLEKSNKQTQKNADRLPARMNISEVPKLNPWPYLVVDALLLSGAAAIGLQSNGPLSGMPLLVVGVLLFLGAVIAILPFLLNFSRGQENALNERQREIAALAQSTAASAEQLGIATASLHTIGESVVKSIKHADQLPQKLQEKIHEFKEQLNEVSMNENEALSQEVNTLRAAETERIETILTTVRKLSSEIARLEAASRKNVTELADSLVRFTTSAEQAAAEATTAIASLRADAEKSLAMAHVTAMRGVEETLGHALAEIDIKLAKLSGHLTTRVDHASDVLDRKIAELKDATFQIDAGAATASAARVVQDESMITMPAREGVPSESAVPDAEAPTASVEGTPREALGNDAPVLPNGAPDEAEKPKSTRTRPARRQPEDNALSLDLDLSSTGPDHRTPVMAESADGATRLLVTAYIGIGNKLFLRGDGPGLSWETGVPLQFVSIGKWRWETAEASAPVRGKLYKNDEFECAALGELILSPRHQYEVTATF